MQRSYEDYLPILSSLPLFYGISFCVASELAADDQRRSLGQSVCSCIITSGRTD